MTAAIIAENLAHNFVNVSILNAELKRTRPMTKIDERYDDEEYVEEQMEQARERELFKNLRIKDAPIYHVYPLGDTKEHATHGDDCWCKPTLDGERQLIVHNSADGREDFETGKRKMS